MAWSGFGIFLCDEQDSFGSFECFLKLHKASGKFRTVCSFMACAKDRRNKLKVVIEVHDAQVKAMHIRIGEEKRGSL